MEQKITELDADMTAFLQKQNDWVKGHFTPETQYKYDTDEGKLYLLENLLSQNMYSKTQTAELQALGICLGEVLASQIGLKWVIVEDEYGRDPGLRYQDSSILLFPLTMISKRIENDEVADVRGIVEQVKMSIENIIK